MFLVVKETRKAFPVSVCAVIKFLDRVVQIVCFQFFFYFKRAPSFRLFFFFYSLFGSSTKTEKSIINRKLFYIKLTKEKDTHISSKAKGKKKKNHIIQNTPTNLHFYLYQYIHIHLDIQFIDIPFELFHSLQKFIYINSQYSLILNPLDDLVFFFFPSFLLVNNCQRTRV